MPTTLAGMVLGFKFFYHQSFMSRISAFFKCAGYLLSCRHNPITKVDYGLSKSNLREQSLAFRKRSANERLPVKVHDIIRNIYYWDLGHQTVCNCFSPEPLLQLLEMKWPVGSVSKQFAIQNKFRGYRRYGRYDLWKRTGNIFELP